MDSGIARDWYVSSFTASNNTCAQTRFHDDGTVEIRNRKNPEAGTATFTGEEWQAFTLGVKNGEFDAV